METKPKQIVINEDKTLAKNKKVLSSGTADVSWPEGKINFPPQLKRPQVETENDLNKEIDLRRESRGKQAEEGLSRKELIVSCMSEASKRARTNTPHANNLYDSSSSAVPTLQHRGTKRSFQSIVQKTCKATRKL